MELNATLTPAQAFAIARNELGEGVELSQEFARAGSRGGSGGWSWGSVCLECHSSCRFAEGFPGWEPLLEVLECWESPFELLSALKQRPVTGDAPDAALHAALDRSMVDSAHDGGDDTQPLLGDCLRSGRP